MILTEDGKNRLVRYLNTPTKEEIERIKETNSKLKKFKTDKKSRLKTIEKNIKTITQDSKKTEPKE